MRLLLLLLPFSFTAYSNYEDFCLSLVEPSEHMQTKDRLTVVRNHKIGNIIIDFYGIPVWSGISPYTEGCSPEDGKLFIYDEESQKPLFHKADNMNNFKIYIGSEVNQYSNIFSKVNEAEFAISHGYMGNTGGSYSLLFFSTDDEFEYLGESYYDPDKYGGRNGEPLRPSFTEFDENGEKVNVYPQ